MKKICSNIANWFKNYTLSFHMYNWILPALCPIIAVGLFFWVLKKLKLDVITCSNLFMNFSSQLFYFSFLLLINNIAIYYIYGKSKQSNLFTLSLFFAILTFLIYVANTFFVLSNSQCDIITVIAISLISIIFSCTSVYLYSKNAEAAFNINDDESAKLSEERNDKSKTLEDRIKSDD